jgi:hypothetical protein
MPMSYDYGISPNIVHWSCMVDILWRAQHWREAELLIKVPIEVNVTAWGALLHACKSYDNVEFGEVSAKQRDEFIFDGHFHLQNHMLASENNFRH